jgi:hypothetical protein
VSEDTITELSNRAKAADEAYRCFVGQMATAGEVERRHMLPHYLGLMAQMEQAQAAREAALAKRQAQGTN